MTYSMECRNAPYGCLGTADDMGSGYCDGCETEELCPECDREAWHRCGECDGCLNCCVCPCFVCGEVRSQCQCGEGEEE